MTSAATVGLISLLGCAADSKPGRRDNASATTLSRLVLYFTEKLTPQRSTATSLSFARGVGCLRPCVMTHGPYRLRTAYLQGDRRETSLVHISWHDIPCRVLDNYSQLLAADAIDSRRRALRRMHSTALTRSRLRNCWRHRPHGMVCLGLQSPR